MAPRCVRALLIRHARLNQHLYELQLRAPGPGIIPAYHRAFGRSSFVSRQVLRPLSFRRGTSEYRARHASLMSLLGDTTDTRTALLYYLAMSENETNDEIDTLFSVIIQLLYDKMEDAHRIRDLEPARDRNRRWRMIAGLRRCLGIFETEATAQARPLLRVRLCVGPDSRFAVCVCPTIVVLGRDLPRRERAE